FALPVISLYAVCAVGVASVRLCVLISLLSSYSLKVVPLLPHHTFIVTVLAAIPKSPIVAAVARQRRLPRHARRQRLARYTERGACSRDVPRGIRNAIAERVGSDSQCGSLHRIPARNRFAVKQQLLRGYAGELVGHGQIKSQGIRFKNIPCGMP